MLLPLPPLPLFSRLRRKFTSTSTSASAAFYPGYGYGGGYYPVYEPYYGGISCNKGRKIVNWSGFHNVNAFDCSAPVYQYKAWKNGHKYRVKVGMYGNIIGVKKI